MSDRILLVKIHGQPFDLSIIQMYAPTGDSTEQEIEDKGTHPMNTWFLHHQRHLYTWNSPGDCVRNQIDYITINRRFCKSMHQVKGRLWE